MQLLLLLIAFGGKKSRQPAVAVDKVESAASFNVQRSKFNKLQKVLSNEDMSIVFDFLDRKIFVGIELTKIVYGYYKMMAAYKKNEKSQITSGGNEDSSESIELSDEQIEETVVQLQHEVDAEINKSEQFLIAAIQEYNQHFYTSVAQSHPTSAVNVYKRHRLECKKRIQEFKDKLNLGEIGIHFYPFFNLIDLHMLQELVISTPIEIPVQKDTKRDLEVLTAIWATLNIDGTTNQLDMLKCLASMLKSWHKVKFSKVGAIKGLSLEIIKLDKETQKLIQNRLMYIILLKVSVELNTICTELVKQIQNELNHLNKFK